MLTADQTTWDESVNRTTVDKPFIEKQVLYIQDQNNGSYSGQVQFDCSSLSNNNLYTDYSSAYFTFPILITAKSTLGGYQGTANDKLFNSLSVGLKSGYFNFIDSMQVDLNNVNICQLQPNLNMLVNYKLLTSMSHDDIEKMGAIIGFYPDSADSYIYQNTASQDGIGFCNNRNETPTSTYLPADGSAKSNYGFYRRQKETVGNSTQYNKNKVVGTTSDTGAAITGKSNIFKSEGRNYYYQSGDPAAPAITDSFNWVILATIRLKDISDFFDKLPISKGLNLRFTINLNTFSANITTTANNMTITSYTQLSGRTCPIMLASKSANNSNSTFIAVAGNFDITCGIAKNSLNSESVTSISTTRLYVPAYKLDPDYQTTLLKQMPVTNIRYYDYYTYTINSITAGNTFNQILTNGILNPKAIIVIPFVSKSDTGNNLTQAQSIFDSAPCTTAPSASITNFQVMLAGSNVFNNYEIYSFSQFLDEFQELFAINGSKTTGVNSGLINKYEWDNAYRFYVCDLSRRVVFENKIPKSVQIEGRNNTAVSMDYVCFLLFEKEVVINTHTGEIVSTMP